MRDDSHNPALGWVAPGISLALSIAAIVYTGAERADFGDAADYLAAARSVLEGKGYPFESSLPIVRAPLYPLLIAAVWRIAPPVGILGVKLVQAILLAACCRVLYKLGMHLHKNHLAAVCGSLIFALNPFYYAQVAEIQTETLHTLLIAAAVLLITRAILSDTVKARFLALAGITFGLASLCRTSAFGIGVALALVLPFLRSDGELTLRKGVIASIVLLGSMLAAIAPWTAYIWHARHEFILLSSGAGFALWLGNHPDSLPLYESSFKSKEDMDKLGYSYLQVEAVRAQVREWEQAGGYSSLPLRARDRLWRDAAAANAVKNLSVTARLWAHKTWTFWRPWLLPGPYPWPIVIVSGIVICSLYLLAAAAVPGLARLPGQRRFLFVLAAIFVSGTLIHTLTVSMLRYRLPYVDPYLCMLAGMTVWRCADRVPALRAISSRW